MPMAQTKDRTNRTIVHFFFIFAASTLRPAHRPPRPTTIIMINTMLPENTTGATDKVTVFFFQQSMPMRLKPTNSRPRELTGRNICSSTVKSQILAAYSSFHSALQKPAMNTLTQPAASSAYAPLTILL